MDQCKLCNSPVSKKRKIKSVHDSLVYTLFECNNCHSCFFDLNENPVDIDFFYAKLADGLDLQNSFKHSIYWRNQVNRIMKIRSTPKNVLDVGCRTGDFLLHFEGKIDKSGVEISKDVAVIAEKRGLKIYNTFIEKTDFGDNKFDIITCYNILEHVENPLLVIDKLTSLVSEKGILVILVPNIGSIKAIFLNLIHYRWHMLCPPEHLNFYSRKILDEYMETKGFEVVDRIHTSGGTFNLFSKVPVFSRLFLGVMFLIDYYTPLNKIPIFDHMYSYYVKK